jgi:hypothetical protein
MKIKFKLLVAFSAFLVAGCAAFFSVFGLSQLFAGASLAVIIMASSLEFAKIISVSFLQRYWAKISKTLKIYLSIGVVVLVCITSAGIYGFLSNAYQKTATQYEIGENELSALSDKKALFQKNIDDNKAILATKTKRLDQLSSLRTNQEIRLNQAQSNGERNRVRNDISSATNEIQTLNTEIDALNTKINPFVDSVNVYESKLIESKSKNSGASEVGPLKYIAKLVGQPMDKVVNWFILLLIFVFDPLAMALVIASNKLIVLEAEEAKESESIEESDEDFEYDEVEEVYDGNEDDEIVEGNTEEPLVNPETGEINLKYNTGPIEQDYWLYTPKTPDNEPEGVYTEISEPGLQITDESQSEPLIVENPTIFYTGVTSEFSVVEEQPVTVEPNVDVVEEIKKEALAPVIEEEPKTEPVVPTGYVKLEDIKEIKAQNRGFSKEIPPPSHNTIQRIGSNKHTKNSDNDTLYFKKRRQ